MWVRSLDVRIAPSDDKWFLVDQFVVWCRQGRQQGTRWIKNIWRVLVLVDVVVARTCGLLEINEIRRRGFSLRRWMDRNRRNWRRFCSAMRQIQFSVGFVLVLLLTAVKHVDSLSVVGRPIDAAWERYGG